MPKSNKVAPAPASPKRDTMITPGSLSPTELETMKATAPQAFKIITSLGATGKAFMGVTGSAGSPKKEGARGR